MCLFFRSASSVRSVNIIHRFPLVLISLRHTLQMCCLHLDATNHPQKLARASLYICAFEKPPTSPHQRHVTHTHVHWTCIGHTQDCTVKNMTITRKPSANSLLPSKHRTPLPNTRPPLLFRLQHHRSPRRGTRDTRVPEASGSAAPGAGARRGSARWPRPARALHR